MHKIAVIAGDGTGPEVTAEAVKGSQSGGCEIRFQIRPRSTQIDKQATPLRIHTLNRESAPRRQASCTRNLSAYGRLHWLRYLLVGCSQVSDSTPAGNAPIAPAGSLDRFSGTGVDGGSGVGLSAAPGLGSLTVSPLSISPQFDPTVHDYVVPCAAGTNTLSLAFTPRPATRPG